LFTGATWIKDLEAGLFVGQRNFSFAIELARTEQRWIQRVWPVRGHEKFRLAE
jgi:hypothetical protein